MSIARHHNEWLGLVEQSGPFLSVPVLTEPDVFVNGLDQHEPELFRHLRAAYDEWRATPFDLYGAWVEFILREVLGYTGDVLRSGQDLPNNAQIRIQEHGETVRADYAVVNPASGESPGKLRVLVLAVPVGQDLDKAMRNRFWKASPNTRMVELLRGTGTRIGLVTNGEDWTLVHWAPEITAGFAAFKADLWCEESITLRAFQSLLRFKRLFGVADENTLEKLYERSALNQQEVTDQLGLQVRHAVEILVSRLDRLDQDNGRDLLRHVQEKRVYEAALTVMMRLVFLMCAEERGLFPMDEPIYAQHYAVTTLRDHLREIADKQGEEILERRHDAWVRLLALFRLIFGGSNDDRLRIVAYGGGLFDPDRFAFLEGRPAGTTWREADAHPLPVDNRTVLHLLEALQVLRINGEARRISFRALDIEQIGHVYEGLLDHTATRALPGNPVLGLAGTSKLEPEIELARLEALRAQGDEALVAFLTEETGRSDGALWNSSTKPKSAAKRGKKKPAAAPPEDLFGSTPDTRPTTPDPIAWPPADHEAAGKLLAACNGDEALYRRVLPFAGIIRTDTFGNPVVIPGGAIFVTQGTDRRSTGTHYTPRTLTEPIVQYTLEPLVYTGPAEGLPREDWKLRAPRALLELKICDMAMGSGAFLVQACRYMSERLVESWEQEEARTGQTLTFPEADPATGKLTERPLPKDTEERTALARRAIAERCLYGVDKNPLAVEIAKLSLWLITLDKNRPFTFVDHALKAGDSLLGCIDTGQITTFHLDPREGRLLHNDFISLAGNSVIYALMAKASEARRMLESFVVKTPADARQKDALLAEADRAAYPVKLIGNLVTGAALRVARKDWKGDYNGLLEAWLAEHVQFAFGPEEEHLDPSAHREVLELAAEAALNRRWEGKTPNSEQMDLDAFRKEIEASDAAWSSTREPFHWCLEFPEVTAGGGFSAFVGNPPFQGGQKITGALGTDYRDYLVEHLGAGRRGSADLCAYFFLRAHALLRDGGHAGLIATNTIAQGDTREVGLEALVGAGKEVRTADDPDDESGRAQRFENKRNWRIPAMPMGGDGGGSTTILRASSSRKWPGVANLEIAEVWWRKAADWAGAYALNGKPVSGITPFLTVPGRSLGKPNRLLANEGKSFIGSYVLGMGFVLEPEQAQALIDKDPRNRDVLFPYLNGEDLNSRPDQSPSRWVINFKDWPLERSADVEPRWTNADERQRKDLLRTGVVPPDYPEPVARDYPTCIEIVERLVRPERQKQNREMRARRWWQFAERCPELYDRIDQLPVVLTLCRVTKYMAVSKAPNRFVFSIETAVFSLVPVAFAVLQNSIYEHFVREHTSTLETRLRFSPSDCFETFPFPAALDALDAIGERYHEHRRQVMLTRQEGLTKTYNRFHNPRETSADIQTLRDLHVEMDGAVLEAFRLSPGEATIWTGFGPDDLQHGFHETKQGLRYTVSEQARRELLDRLLELNHKRYAEEVAAGLHDKKKPKAAKKPAKAEPADDLFGAAFARDDSAEATYTPPKDRQQALMALLLELIRHRPGLAEDEYADALGDAVRIKSHLASLTDEQQDQLHALLPQIPEIVFNQKKKQRPLDLWNALQQYGYIRVTLDGATRHFELTQKAPKKDHGWLIWPVEGFAELVFAVGGKVDREEEEARDLVGFDLEGAEV